MGELKQPIPSQLQAALGELLSELSAVVLAVDFHS